jgi:hypothetical protein
MPLKLPWRRSQEEDDPYWDFFINSAPADANNTLVTALRNAPEGAVNPVKEDIHTPEIAARHVKELARFLGADLVGIARREDDGLPFAVVCALRADYDPRQAAGIGGQVPVEKGLFVTFIVSAWMREMGYQATTKVAVDGDQLAVAAALGTLNTEGRLVTPQFGPKVYVVDPILTDLPLASDG